MEALSPPLGVPVAWRAPFATGAPWRDERPAGETLLDIARSVPDLPEVFFRRGIICVNGEAMSREHWGLIRPKPTTAERPISVTLHLPLQGGGGGSGSGKQVVAVVAAIALTIATAGVAGGALGPLLGAATFGVGTTGAAIAAATIGVAGELAVVHLPPPS